MKKAKLFLVMIPVLLIIGLVVTGCSESTSTASDSELSRQQLFSGSQKVDTGGNVSVAVEWQKADDGSLVFEVSMNTHSVDLDGYDLAELSVLRADSGTEYLPVSWDSAPGGHHRSGRLVFPSMDDPDTISAGKWELTIRDIAGIKERTYRW